MSPERSDFARQDLKAIEADLKTLGPLGTFPWHTQQEWALRSATDVVQINGGNQSGKSLSGMGIVSRLIRREGPVYDRLEKPEGRTLLVWIAPKTTEKYFSVWEPGLVNFVLAGMTAGKDYHYRQSPFPVFTKFRPDGTADWIIAGKAQKQGFLAFESDAVDLVILDEEPEDPRIVSSCKARFSTTNGVLVLCFTPLLGMSWTYHQHYAPAVKPRYRLADRVWKVGNVLTVIEMGMADNPASVAGGGVARLQADPSISEAERNARLYGKYGFTEGLIFPAWVMLGLVDDDPYLLDSLPEGRAYTWVLAADPNKRHAGLLVAIDHEGNRFYAQEHYAESLPDSQHAAEYKRMLGLWNLGLWDADIWADPGGAGSQAIINLAEHAIFAKPIPKDPGSVSASIKRLRGAAFPDPKHRHPVTGTLGAPRTYFLRYNESTGKGLRSTWTVSNVVYHESRLMYELRQYRQEPDRPPDTPVKVQDDAVDCARYVELARSITPGAPVDDEEALAKAGLDDVSRLAVDEYDAMAAKAAAQFADRQASAKARWEAERRSNTTRRIA